MGGGGGKDSGGNETSSSGSSAPWEGQIPYLIGGTDAQGNEVKGVLPEAARLYDNGGLAGDYYTGDTVASESPYTTSARDMIYNRATQGSDVINQATQGATDIVNGTALSNNTGLNTLNQYSQSTNPYIDSLYQQAAQNQNTAINSNFEANGRYGSGAQAQAIADADQQLANEMYSNAYNQAVTAAGNAANAYNTGVSNQVSALSQAQNLGNQAYTDASNLAEAGASLDDYNQSVVDADVDRWNYNEQKDMTALQNYLNLVGGQYGGTSESTSTTSGSSGSKGGK